MIQSDRLKRAYQSLQGLSVGDAFGSYFEAWRGNFHKKYLQKRQMPDEMWRFTDDTMMALSIIAILRDYGVLNQDELALSFAQHYDDSRGYGMGAMKLMVRLQKGEYWRDVTPTMFRGEGSFGNGGAMRVAPLGAYFADDMDALIENARLSAEITHAHPEGIAGAIAIAVASAVAFHYRDQDQPTIADFIAEIIEHIPDSEVKDNCITAQSVAPDVPIEEAAMILGNGRHVAAMDTVPIALWAAVKYFDKFEDAMWGLASIGGDVDTTCAITGGIIASYAPDAIPKEWLNHREAIPQWATNANGV